MGNADLKVGGLSARMAEARAGEEVGGRSCSSNRARVGTARTAKAGGGIGRLRVDGRRPACGARRKAGALVRSMPRDARVGLRDEAQAPPSAQAVLAASAAAQAARAAAQRARGSEKAKAVRAQGRAARDAAAEASREFEAMLQRRMMRWRS